MKFCWYCFTVYIFLIIIIIIIFFFNIITYITYITLLNGRTGPVMVGAGSDSKIYEKYSELKEIIMIVRDKIKTKLNMFCFSLQRASLPPEQQHLRECFATFYMRIYYNI